MPSGTLAPESLVDLHRYPLLELDSPAGAAVVAAARRQLAAGGAAALDGFVSSAGLAALLAEARALAPLAYPSRGEGPAYLDGTADGLPEGHPRRWRGRYQVGVVAYDQFPESSPLRALFEWDPLADLVSAILRRSPLYRYADPLGALNLAVMGEGDELQWHFDQTDFVVSLALQDAGEGGDLEVHPRLRAAGDERYERVAAALAGATEGLLRLPMRPGTLLVFEGRHSLHRVSRVGAGADRLVGLLGYDTEPGTVSGERLRRSRYGRTS